MTSTRAELQRALADRLGSVHESRWMVEEVLGRSYPGGAPVDGSVRDALAEMVARREAGEPLQYVLGTWAFRCLELEVDARALIPRPETEQVVEVAIQEIRGAAPSVVVDLGTGTGAIALSLAVELSPARQPLEVWATDADPAALTLAERNRARVGARCAAARRVRLARGSWFDALPGDRRGRLDLVVANPPYVGEEEWQQLDPEVWREPYGAIVAGRGSDGTTGFADVAAIVGEARDWLAPGGVLVVELSPLQASAARRLARDRGYSRARIEPDLAGRDRMLVARR